MSCARWLVASWIATQTSTVSTRTSSAAAVHADDEELARYLFILENWELLNELDLFEIAPVLDEAMEAP
ncbi:MAG: hypothetical protein HC923_06455 [Myxococcales bacterium]|nr:hypothetical protein [Myxococcales bacterium]